MAAARGMRGVHFIPPQSNQLILGLFSILFLLSHSFSHASSFDWTGEWIPSPDPVVAQPSCPLKNTIHYTCPTASWGSYWQWKSFSRQFKESHDPYQCLPPNQQVCFIGDSLARQFYIDVACDYGISHEYQTSFTQNKVRYTEPVRSILPNNVTMSFRFHLMVDLTKLRKNDHNIIKGCDVAILSYGAWNLGMADHLLQPLYYGNVFEHAVSLMQAYSPNTLIIIKPNTAGLLNETYHLIRRHCDENKSSPLNNFSDYLREVHYNKKVSAYNKQLYQVARNTNAMILGERHGSKESVDQSIVHTPFYMSLLHPCSYSDVLHFCQPFTVSSSIYREFGRLLADNICSKYSK